MLQSDIGAGTSFLFHLNMEQQEQYDNDTHCYICGGPWKDFHNPISGQEAEEVQNIQLTGVGGEEG